ncbi:MAG: hypothetical protein HYS57_03180 [Parcubacteria group bacterium]|nr:hypothetical protein [Parcubacteria group bacterium]
MTPQAGVSERTSEGRARAARLASLQKEARESVTATLDDLDVRERPKATQVRQEQVKTASQKLQEAREFGERMHQDLRDLCSGLEQRLAEMGYAVTQAYQFSQMERFVAIFSKDRAQRSRLARLERQSVRELVLELNRLTADTINELGEIQGRYEGDETDYTRDIKRAIAKLKAAQPRYQEAKALREELEGALKTLKLELEAGTISEEERPAKEEEFDQLNRDYQDALLIETGQLEIVKQAQWAIPELTKSRDSAKQAITSIEQMRIGLLEKQQHFTNLFENAMTAVIAQLRLERFQNMDPAFNAAVTKLTEHNIKVAAALMDTAIERAKIAPISPEESLRLTTEMKANVEAWLRGIEELEEITAKGARQPVPSGDDDASGNDVRS